MGPREILANIWGANVIARIDPRTGEVRGYLDLASLSERRPDEPDAVLNGIAYDEAKDRLFVTGKLWTRSWRSRGRSNTSLDVLPPRWKRRTLSLRRGGHCVQAKTA